MLSSEVTTELEKLVHHYDEQGDYSIFFEQSDDAGKELLLLGILSNINEKLSDRKYRGSSMLDSTVRHGLYIGIEAIKKEKTDQT